MYSPKIAERLIPPIYRLARARGQAMTTLVNEALTRYLADEDARRALEAADQPASAVPLRADAARQVPSAARRAA